MSRSSRSRARSPATSSAAAAGYLHELRDQRASFEPIAKWSARARSAEDVPELLAEAWQRARTPPSGPVFLEIPVDVLTGETDCGSMDSTVARPPLSCPTRLDWTKRRRVLAGAERPLVWAGSGVLRSGAWDELRAVAEALRAPVVTSYMGKGAFPEDHELSAGSACDEAAFRRPRRGSRCGARRRLGARRRDDAAIQRSSSAGSSYRSMPTRNGSAPPSPRSASSATRARRLRLLSSACPSRSRTAARRNALAPSAGESPPGSTSRAAISSAASSNRFETRCPGTPQPDGT